MRWDALEQTLYNVYYTHELDDWSGLYWHNNRTMIPLDIPPCGWHDDLCVIRDSNNTMVVVVSTLSSVFLLAMFIMVVIAVKKYRYERVLKEIENASIKWSQMENVKAMKYVKYRLSEGGIYVNHENVIHVAHLGDHVTVLEKIRESSLNFQDRNVLIDIQKIQKTIHDNLNLFFGVCTDGDQIYTIMQYCIRGTIPSIIADDQVNLTKDFRISFVLDIGCGMQYLHQSSVQYHGNLTSSKCIVDNRWNMSSHWVWAVLYQTEQSHQLWTTYDKQ